MNAHDCEVIAAHVRRRFILDQEFIDWAVVIINNKKHD